MIVRSCLLDEEKIQYLKNGVICMETYTLDGEKYYYKNGKWLNSSYMTVPTSLVSKLNKLLTADVDITEKSIDELIEIIDGAKNGNNIQLALKAAECAIDKANETELRKLLPRTTSIFRQIGQSQKAIDTAERLIEKYGKAVWSPALFTSIAAAYCDLDQLETARKYANRARALSGANSSVELMSVYSRLKMLEN